MNENNQKVADTQGVEVTTELEVTAEMVEATENMVNVLEDMVPIMEVTSEYIKFEKDEVRNFVYVGIVPMKSVDGKSTVEAVKVGFMDEDKDFRFGITAATVLVGSAKQLKQGTPLRVTCLGKKKGKEGEYDNNREKFRVTKKSK